ncbi:MAG: 50S ribosomal protein L6 [Endomicrobium sp.]|jgi:large subunit ribosomal protein L6|nr:50S ribosomal protein L6 [Endomicrobium sp.]
MSRLENKPVEIPDGVEVLFINNILEVNGPMGTLRQLINNNVKLTIDSVKHIIIVKKDKNVCKQHKRNSGLQGLFRGLIINMLKGVTIGFKKDLELKGLGYKVSLESNKIILFVGFSHPVTIVIPKELKVKATIMQDKTTLISILGIDKCEVGTFAATLRQVKPPDPYKGFGIKYFDEQIIRKAGKVATSSK